MTNGIGELHLPLQRTTAHTPMQLSTTDPHPERRMTRCISHEKDSCHHPAFQRARGEHEHELEHARGVYGDWPGRSAPCQILDWVTANRIRDRNADMVMISQ